jgi:N6-adenosine-specific RNA methylase IME4
MAANIQRHTARTPTEVVELIKRLAPQHTNAEIAAELQAAGLRTGAGLPFNAQAVRFIRRASHIPADRRPAR